jgi:hypothetical protein
MAVSLVPTSNILENIGTFLWVPQPITLEDKEAVY